MLLVDSRHGLKTVDTDMMTMLDEAAVGYRLVLTKSDKISATDLNDVLQKVSEEARKHAAAHPEIHVTSAAKGMGTEDLRAAVLADIST